MPRLLLMAVPGSCNLMLLLNDQGIIIQQAVHDLIRIRLIEDKKKEKNDMSSNLFVCRVIILIVLKISSAICSSAPESCFAKSEYCLHPIATLSDNFVLMFSIASFFRRRPISKNLSMVCGSRRGLTKP